MGESRLGNSAWRNQQSHGDPKVYTGLIQMKQKGNKLLERGYCRKQDVIEILPWPNGRIQYDQGIQ